MHADPDTTDAVYRSFLENASSPMGIVRLFEDDFVFVTHNSAAASLLGMTADELRGRRAADLSLNPDEIRYIRERLGEACAAPARFEYPYTPPGLPLRWIAVNAWPLLASPCDMCLVGYCAEDITTRRRSEKSLRECEAHFRAIFENSTQAIGIAADGLIQECNSAFLELFGFRSSSDLLGQPLTALVAPQERHRVLSLLSSQADKTGGPAITALKGLRADGTEMPIEGYVSTYIQDGRGFTVAILSYSGTQHFQDHLIRRNRDLERDNSELKTLATIDPLTELLNRRILLDRLAQQFYHARAADEPLSLLMVDVDHFKKFNDTFGHVQGDEVLRQVARVLQETGRDGDTVARYGGEEFAILLPGTGFAGAAAFAARIREALAAVDWPLRKITVSVGGAVFSHEMTNPTDLIIDADRALYEAKGAGRDRAAFR